MGDVRKATAADRRRLGEALARAFHDDPLTGQFIPPGSRNHHRRLARFMEVGAISALEHGSVFTTPDVVAAAVWRSPGHWKVPTADLVRYAPTMARCMGRRMLAGLRALNAIEAKHPTEPHWYLEILGTEPAHQGKGIGSALMEPILRRCDEEGLGAYLESSKASNVPYYRRHGFRVTEELPLPDDGPTVWLMWRDPQT